MRPQKLALTASSIVLALVLAGCAGKAEPTHWVASNGNHVVFISWTVKDRKISGSLQGATGQDANASQPVTTVDQAVTGTDDNGQIVLTIGSGATSESLSGTVKDQLMVLNGTDSSGAVTMRFSPGSEKKYSSAVTSLRDQIQKRQAQAAYDAAVATLATQTTTLQTALAAFEAEFSGEQAAVTNFEALAGGFTCMDTAASNAYSQSWNAYSVEWSKTNAAYNAADAANRALQLTEATLKATQPASVKLHGQAQLMTASSVSDDAVKKLAAASTTDDSDTAAITKIHSRDNDLPYC
ncbi:hypothetical protein G3T36_02670 [Diaminobutyricibacter tongyongensis]|uniref:Lipoprotein n=1 Tax=Leifsonia tongyongensis TaxID=1268043 RepID=A0A6L9XUL1_9MICO|nr:hypothetical protein [Diaminobutyricibacter tongyongensis]NEN04764.1 hypothetical protein [Diaminobutyricibacter tongyongensis]